MSSKVTLITGVNGLIGHAVASRLCAAGESIVGMDRVIPVDPALDCPVVKAELSDAHRLRAAMDEYGVTHILHAGGISGPMLSRDDPAGLFAINVTGTQHVLEAARVAGAKRLVFLSSFVAYGEQQDDETVSEDRALTATDPYACSKIASEAIVRAYRAHHGLEGISLRLGSVYGPRRTTTCFIRLMLENALAGKETRLDFGSGWRRPYVHNDDVVEAICQALDAPFESMREHAYNVSGPQWLTLDEVGEVVAEVARGARVSLAPGRNPLDCRVGRLDLTAIERDLGFLPAVHLADGITRYYAWLKERRDN